MLIYEVYYIETETINSDFYDEDGYHDDYYDYTIQQHINVKYYRNKKDAIKYCEEHFDQNYLWKEIKVE